MPRLDGYPAADKLTGAEITTAMQGGATKSVTTAQLIALAQTGLLPIVEQMIADAIAGLVPIVPPVQAPRLVSDAGSLLADDAGSHLLAA